MVFVLLRLATSASGAGSLAVFKLPLPFRKGQGELAKVITWVETLFWGVTVCNGQRLKKRPTTGALASMLPRCSRL